MQRTSSEVNTTVTPDEMSQQEPGDFQIQHADHQEEAGALSENLTRGAAAFAINVREQCHLSQRSVSTIVSGVQWYQAALLNTLRGTMRRVFRHSDSMEQLQEEALATLDNFQDPSSIMATTYMQDSTNQKLFNPVKPEEIVISQRVCRVKKGQSRVLAIKYNSFYCIPLIKSLEQLLSNSRIFDMINTAPQSCPKVQLRQWNRLRRRLYTNPGPIFLWHVDSYDKLKPHGICINGAVDGFSCMVMWLHAYTTNRNPRFTSGYFIDEAEDRSSTPTRIRADLGTENRSVEQMQIFLRGTRDERFSERCYITGSSNHNQRIEQWRGFLREHHAQYWTNVFQDLKDHDHFSGDFTDKKIHTFHIMLGND